MRTLKIGVVTQSYYPYFGGVTEHAHNMALGLQRLGHSVTVITGGPNDEGSRSTVRVLRKGRTVLVPSNGSRGTVTVGFGLGNWLREVIHSERFDILSCQCPLAPTLPLIAIKHAPCPVVGTFHSSAERNLGYTVFRRALRFYHSRLQGKIAVSEPARRFVQGYFGGEYRIIHNGVDTRRFRPHLSPIERFNDGRFNVLYVGRLDPRKGLDVLTSAFKGLWEAERGRVRLIVVGDGPLRGRLLRSIPRDLRGAVSFEGKVSPEMIPRYYASCRVLCSPATKSESFGIVLLEAMASGVPVVAANIPGYRTAVKNGVQGLLVEPGSPRSLTTALRLLARDESLRQDLAHAGLENSRNYSWDNIVRRIESYFVEVLNGAAGEAVSRSVPEPRPATQVSTVQ